VDKSSKEKKRPNSVLLRDIASKKQQDIKTRENSIVDFKFQIPNFNG
jgi:hypothetical protein